MTRGTPFLLVILSSLLAAGFTAGSVPNPVLSMASGGRGEAIGGMGFDVTQYGYQEKEYFFEGTAKAYGPGSESIDDAPYKSRMIVWTPIDPSRFNGTTVVEWAQQSVYELTVEVNFQAQMLMDKGYAFVLVTAEPGGVGDCADADSCSGSTLKGTDFERYGSLHHPGDNYSFDIFSQALKAIKFPMGSAPMDGLKTDIVIAEGFQVATDRRQPQTEVPILCNPDTAALGCHGTLNAYISNGADADAQLADAFLIDAYFPPDNAQYRVPTLHHLTEDAMSRRPIDDSSNHVIWEVVGGPHADRWAGTHAVYASAEPAPKRTREEEDARRDLLDNFYPDDGSVVCVPAPGYGSVFPRRFTLNAGTEALREWVLTSVPAPAAARADRIPSDISSPTMKLLRDSNGNATGGLRSPIIQVPVATYDGEACVISGTVTLLPQEQLGLMYTTHADYVQQILAATDDAVANRVLLCQDAETIMRKASASTYGGSDMFTAAPSCTRTNGGDAPETPNDPVNNVPRSQSSGGSLSPLLLLCLLLLAAWRELTLVPHREGQQG